MEYSEDRIAMALVPRQVRYFPSIGSTNDAALAWVQEGAPKNAVVVADEQTSGRGRHGRTWYTPPGVAIAASVLVSATVEQLPHVSLAGGLAVLGLLDALNIPKAELKWPNDVLVDGRKVSGVLAEAVWDGERLRGAILGLGVNVRNDFGGTAFASTATSIEAVLGQPTDRVLLLTVLLFRLEDTLELMGTDRLIERYRARLPMLGGEVSVQRGTETISGRATDLTDDGALQLTLPDGRMEIVRAGDVTVMK